MPEDKYYWVKTSGDVVEISEEKFRQWTIIDSSKHKLVWVYGRYANFIDKGNSLWVTFDVLEKILAIKHTLEG